MKRFVLSIMLLVCSLTVTFAQDTIVYDVSNLPEFTDVCVGKTICIYAEDECDYWTWKVNNVPQNMENPLIIQSQIEQTICVEYYGCNVNVYWSYFYFNEPITAPSFTQIIYKRFGESITINPATFGVYGESFQWSNGEITPEITVTEANTYILETTDVCGTTAYTFIIRDNVEIDLATCDLESNLNMVTWPTTVAQAEYIDHLNVKRDGMMVATANYSDGFFLDNIGSDAAPRTYSLIAVGTDGTECPIESYPKETIHMSYLLGVGNTVEVGWNQPSGYDLVGYNICEWNSNGKDGELTVIDFVGAGVTSYTCQTSQFDNGNIVVQGVEAGKTENRLLSNRSWELVGVGEQQVQNFKIYPNPSNGTFTVEGASTLTIYSMLGQIMATSYSENGVHSFTLAPGIYFIKSDEGISKKVVVQ